MLKSIAALVACLLILGCKQERKLSEAERSQIISELEEIKILDQQYAGIPPNDMIEKHGLPKAWELFNIEKDSAKLLTQNKVKNLYKRFGYLGYDKVGEEGESDFWIVAQHADNDLAFQKEILSALEIETKNNNADKAHYAMLEDRVAVNMNKAQRFGSQVKYNERGQAVPKIGLLDSANVEQLRHDYGLDSFKVYYNNMTMMHFEMNKKMYLDKGISEAQLYK